MADKKKLKKEIKLLRKRVKKAMERSLKAQQELSRLQTKMSKRGKQVAAPSGAAAEDALEQSQATVAEGAGLVSAQRAIWKKHSFLRDCYEVRLNEGQDKVLARKLANADLVAKYGEESGFSEQDLQDILT